MNTSRVTLINLPLLTCIFILGATACNHDSGNALTSPTPDAPAVLLTEGKVFAKVKSNNVPFKFYQMMAASPKNINYSPLSTEMAMALVYLGAQGKTKELYEQLFGFADNNEFPFQKEMQLSKDRSQSDTFEFDYGNSVWAKDSKMVNSEYKKTIFEKMGAELGTMDTSKINSWVSKVTQGKIENLIPKLPPLTQFILVNTIYLKAKWTIPFQKQQTHAEHFQASPHLAINTQMMNSTAVYKYFEDTTSKWIELTYQDSPLTMILALPQKQFDLRSIEDKLSSDYVNSILPKMSDMRVELKLPKFSFKTNESLLKEFRDAGYSDLFKFGDYSRLSNAKDFRISDIIQGTFIKVDEEGTEAAAATAVMMLGHAMHITRPKQFYAIEPFLFMIRNTQSGEIYFLGRVFNPLESQ